MSHALHQLYSPSRRMRYLVKSLAGFSSPHDLHTCSSSEALGGTPYAITHKEEEVCKPCGKQWQTYTTFQTCYDLVFGQGTRQLAHHNNNNNVYAWQLMISLGACLAAGPTCTDQLLQISAGYNIQLLQISAGYNDVSRRLGDSWTCQCACCMFLPCPVQSLLTSTKRCPRVNPLSRAAKYWQTGSAPLTQTTF